MFRSHEGPMDFQFENGTGPLDGRSPFAALSQNAQRLPPNTPSRGQKRSYGAFDSPSKSKPSHTPSPSKPLPAVPAFNSLFTTPRKGNYDFDDSSAGETPRSPEQNQDSDATPDNMGLRSTFAKLGAVSMPTQAGAERNSPTKERPASPVRRESWLGTQLTKAKNKWNSPGRGELPRGEHPATADNRIEKRRKAQVDRKHRRRRRPSMSDSGDESEALSKSPRKPSGRQAPQDDRPKQHWISSLFTFIESHPHIPTIASWYAQLAFNIFLLSFFAYVIWSFWSAVQGDVDKKSHEAMADIMAEMAACAEQYTTNRCDRSTRVPAMETVCENWAKCMNRDPSKVARAKVSAHTFAEIFNSFVEPISWKAMGFTVIMVFGCFAISNFAFHFFRRTEGSMAAYPQQPQYYQPPPPTPQRQFSGQDGGFYGGTPWQQYPGGLEPAPSGGYGQIEGKGSPQRRLQY